MKKLVNPWLGVEGYYCFGCSPDNPSGLHMEFYEDGDDIVSYWEPVRHTQGWVDTLHGGIQCSLMDEIAAWVIARKLKTIAVTSKLDAKFIKSISTNEPRLTIRGRIKEIKRNVVFLEAEIYNSQDELCSRSDMIYFASNAEKLTNDGGFGGCKTEDEL